MASIKRHVTWIGTIEKDGIEHKLGLYGCIGEGWAYIYIVDDDGVRASASYERFEWSEEDKAREWIKVNMPMVKSLEKEYTEYL